jgi:hypothetical protein
MSNLILHEVAGHHTRLHVTDATMPEGVHPTGFHSQFFDPRSLVSVSFSFDIPGAGFDEGVWNQDPSVFNAVNADLHEAWEMLPAKKKRKRKKNNAKDALIAEAAKRGDFTLLTADYHLAEVTKKHGIKVCYLKPRREAGSGKY